LENKLDCLSLQKLLARGFILRAFYFTFSVRVAISFRLLIKYFFKVESDSLNDKERRLSISLIRLSIKDCIWAFCPFVSDGGEESGAGIRAW